MRLAARIQGTSLTSRIGPSVLHPKLFGDSLVSVDLREDALHWQLHLTLHSFAVEDYPSKPLGAVEKSGPGPSTNSAQKYAPLRLLR